MNSDEVKTLLCDVLLPLQAAMSLAAQRDAVMKDMDVDVSLITPFSTVVSKTMVLDEPLGKDFAEIYRKFST